MTDPTDPTPEREGARDPADMFQQVFGVSEDDLIRQNIDPAEYARQNIRRALNDPDTASRVLSPSDQLWRVQMRWGRRGFAALFVSIGFLALSHVHPVHWLSIIAAALVVIGALVMNVLVIKYRHQYVEACRKEGVEPEWVERRRQMWGRWRPRQ